MSFRLVPKLVTLNNLERRNGRYSALFYRLRQLWWPISYVKVVEDSCLQQKCSSKNLVFSNL